MTVFSQPTDFPHHGRPVAIAIGFFDGVHLGHQQVLRQTVTDARQHAGLAVAVTFDKHPNTVVAPAHTPLLIQTVSQRLHSIAATGIDATWLIPFDLEFSRQPAAIFVRNLLQAAGTVRSLCVGSSFAFGAGRSGNVRTLQALGADLGFQVHGLASVALDNQIVSSTRIRELIRAGQLETASQMLGKPCAIAGPVVAGRQLGRTLGFPTANLDTPGLALPPNGVYAAQTRIHNTPYRAVLNIGFRPTLQPTTPTPTVEAHLLDFSGDLYGLELEFHLAAHLRPERLFPSKQALEQQIAADIGQARTLL